jgi:hypothetical protein
MGDALEGLDVAFTELFAVGLVVLTFVVALVIAICARRWVRWPAAIGIGVLAAAWSGFMSAGEILKGFDWPLEQLVPLMVFALVTCASQLLLPWPRALRAGFVTAGLILAVQAVIMAVGLADLFAGRSIDASGYARRVPRPTERWLLAAPVPMMLIGLVLLASLPCRDRWRGVAESNPLPVRSRGGEDGYHSRASAK